MSYASQPDSGRRSSITHERPADRCRRPAALNAPAGYPAAGRYRRSRAKRITRCAALSAWLAGLCLCLPVQAQTQMQKAQTQTPENHWYIGLGTGSALLRPTARDTERKLRDTSSVTTILYTGRDLDRHRSVQLSAFVLGTATFDQGAAVSFRGFDAGVLYRFLDSRDYRLTDGPVRVNTYVRCALGYLDRNTDIGLQTTSAVYFGVALGAELRLTPSIGIRFEGSYHELDAASATLSLMARFGGSPPGPARPAGAAAAHRQQP